MDVRTEVIRQLRVDIWRFVTQVSTQEHLLLSPGALLKMSSSDVRSLAQTQFILSDPVHLLLQQMPSLQRRLTNTISSEVEISAERVRGPIKWGETYAQRAARGIPHIYVTAPTRRAFDTPENQVLAFSLRAIADVGDARGGSKAAKGRPQTYGIEFRKPHAGYSRASSSNSVLSSCSDDRQPSPRRPKPPPISGSARRRSPI